MTAPSTTSRIRLALFAVAVVAVLTLVVFLVMRGAAEPSQSGALPSDAAADVVWEFVGQVAVPVSASAGPTRVVGGCATGYARTPHGALIAAAQISTRAGYSAGREVWEPTLTEQFVSGPDRDHLLRLLREADAQDQPLAGRGSLSQIAGFRFVSYTDEAAVIDLVRRTPEGGTHAQTTLTVLWADDDWRMVAPPDGQWPTVTQALTTLRGVTNWEPS